jgi:hypothetical protein
MHAYILVRTYIIHTYTHTHTHTHIHIYIHTYTHTHTHTTSCVLLCGHFSLLIKFRIDQCQSCDSLSRIKSSQHKQQTTHTLAGAWSVLVDVAPKFTAMVDFVAGDEIFLSRWCMACGATQMLVCSDLRCTAFTETLMKTGQFGQKLKWSTRMDGQTDRHAIWWFHKPIWAKHYAYMVM